MDMIRLAGINDTVRLEELVAVMVGDQNPLDIAGDVVKGFFKSEKYKVFVIEVDKRVEGFAVLKVDCFEGADDAAEFVWLGVDISLKRNGYGRILAEHVEYYAKNHGIRKIYLKTNVYNKAAVCFWIKQDYRFEARLLNFGAKGVDDYFLGKDIV